MKKLELMRRKMEGLYMNLLKLIIGYAVEPKQKYASKFRGWPIMIWGMEEIF